MSNVHDGSFTGQYTRVRYRRGSPECTKLEARYPGIRFNDVQADLWAVHMFRHEGESPLDTDYVRVWFSISGTDEVLRRHGFDEPEHCCCRARTLTGRRFTTARYQDGLDRLACLFVPELLAKFMRKEPS
jgi:hypothetical protein